MTNKPLAAKGLISYRYAGTYNWIMIGAKNLADALNEAARSLESTHVELCKLEIWNGSEYVRVDPKVHT